MYRSKIFLIGEHDGLIALEETGYVTENVLQEFLADYPDLLPGDKIAPDNPCRWLLVAREMGVPGDMAETGRWSLDHLFLDQEGIPTFVECKRATDTRARREVVAQMLDYAANGTEYWSMDRLRQAAAETAQKQGKSLDEEIARLIGEDETDVEGYWEIVAANLHNRRVRLIFVADETPKELRRLVEFLNEEMTHVEVLAVEIKQYVGEKFKTLVPHVVGQTLEAVQNKSMGASTGKQWNESSFFQELEARQGANEAAAAQKILEWARPKMTRIWWGKGSRNGSFVPVLNRDGKDHQLFALWTYGTVEIYFYWYQYKPPFDSESKRQELLDRLNAIEGIDLPSDSITRRPGVSLSILKDDQVLGMVHNLG